MLLERFWQGVAALASWLTLSPFTIDGHQQQPLGGGHGLLTDETGSLAALPRFPAPGGDPDQPFICDYSAMGKDWTQCSIPENRECWLRNMVTGQEFNIHTDYEKYAPVGVVRNYELNVDESYTQRDGLHFYAAKLFDKQYPGPWIQACWGDTINVKVKNNLKWNGTSIHWHGIRQNRTMHMDGVNGVTQCPIAPGDSFTYSFKATQYGSSWYHSHYSVQYADGMQGPLTIHGPTAAPYDEPKQPLIMTDWLHISAFAALVVNDGTAPPQLKQNRTILLNGRGNCTQFGFANNSAIEPHKSLTFEAKKPGQIKRAKRYLLRLINTSFDTTFVLSIDNHWLQIVGADFVPIEPYWNTSILIGIGQRYHVIVEANPDGSYVNGNITNSLPTGKDAGKFWIRTYIANCGWGPPVPTTRYEEQGIIVYDDAPEKTRLPASKPWPTGASGDLVSLRCSDETYGSLRPKVPWLVGPAANNQSDNKGQSGEELDVVLNFTQPKPWPHSLFAFQPSASGQFIPLRVNYSYPTLDYLNNSKHVYDPGWVVIPEDYTDHEWVYLVLAGGNVGNGKRNTRGAHPIHLHGHDFAILQVAENATFPPPKWELNLVNPPRRDVVLLPANGFVVIAFKADNPGNWLMHCHIANHASFGLATQFLERRADASALLPWDGPIMKESQRVCKNWREWDANCTHWWPGFPANNCPKRETPFYVIADDSGI